MFSLMLAIMSETNFIESKNKQKYAENSNGFHLITVILLKDILQFLHFKTAWSFLFLIGHVLRKGICLQLQKE